MWPVADKPERMRTFYKIVTELGLDGLTAEKFWSEFWSIWSSSENIFDDEHYLRPIIRLGQTLGPSFLGLTDDERDSFAKLPSIVQIYRGGLPINEIGWSWTTDVDKAKWFAD